jgi:hypothetical protein
MIEITYTHSLKSDASATDISVVGEILLLEKYDEMHARFKQLISQNVILNCYVIVINENNQLLISHFATTPENAQLFISQYVSDTFDTAAFWQPYGIDWKLDQQEIDFDSIDPLTMNMLIDDNDILYGLKNSVPTISSPSRALAKQG